MPASKTQKLSSLFCSGLRATRKAETTPTVRDSPLKHFASSLDTSSPSASTSVINFSPNSPKPKISSPRKPPARFGRPSDLEADSNPDDSKSHFQQIYSLFFGDSVDSSVPRETSDKNLSENKLEVPWFSPVSYHNTLQSRKEVWRGRKQKWIFKNCQTHRFDKLVKMCVDKLGTKTTVEVFGRLGRETGVKEYSSLIRVCIEKARDCDNEDDALEQISRGFQLLNFMKEQGFQLEEETYGPILMYLIDMGMIKEFHFFYKAIENGNSSSVPRLGYYEMLHYIRINDEEKIQELCNRVATDDERDYLNFRENYVLALCESERKSDLLQLLETIDITKISLLDHVASIFKSLGRQSLESLAEKYLLAFKGSDHGAENVSNFIFTYATSIPNLAVDDIVSKFKDLHAKLEITPSAAAYEKLIAYSCDLHEVHVALDVVDQMCEAGLTSSIDTLNSILHVCEDIYEYNLVRRVDSIICRYNLKPDSETFRSMISLSVKMKDFDGAYAMLNNLKKMNLMPTSSMFNTIMAGYFRKKDTNGALNVLKLMEKADMKPDSQTFSYLIQNCRSEDDIIKYYKELKCSGVQATKQVFMALINAYATCGEFEKAKEVVLDKGIPAKSLTEIKGTLVSALASHGQMSDALNIYKEIKETGCSVEPKVIISLIEYLHSEVEFSKWIQLLLEELHDPVNWIEGCCRLILHSVRLRDLSSVIDLLKQLKDKIYNDESVIEILSAEVFSQIVEAEPPDLQFGLDLLQVFKDELGLPPTRKSLDFLLSACVNAKDFKSSLFIWKEYQKADMPYNVLSYLRMYEALLASGDHQSARKMLSKISKDDPHVRIAIRACKFTFSSRHAKGKKKKIKE